MHVFPITVPIGRIINAKNVRAWVSMPPTHLFADKYMDDQSKMTDNTRRAENSIK